MKKILVVFTLFAALIFVISCGGGSSKPADGSDTGETVTDEDSDTADSGSTDNPDTVPDNPDSDDPDTVPDSSDSQPDADTDTNPEPNDNDADSSDSVSDDDSDTADTVPDQDSDADTGNPVVEMEEGIYLGIIGFNDDLTKKPIKRLTDANKSEFKSFISSLTQLNLTALYWADYSALEMMESFTISPDLQLKKVALVTFTDGLDNQSLSSDDFNPGPYDSHADCHSQHDYGRGGDPRTAGHGLFDRSER